MTTTVDQVITIFDAVWKGEGASKSAMLSLQKYQKMGATASIQHMRLAESTDSLKRTMMGLGTEFANTTEGNKAAAKEFNRLSEEITKNEEEMKKLRKDLGMDFVNLKKQMSK